MVFLKVLSHFRRVGSREGAVGQIAPEKTGILVSKAFAVLCGPFGEIKTGFVCKKEGRTCH